MRVLIIDNYDSFTHNLAHQVAICTGLRPTVEKNDGISYQQILSGNFSHIILSPGPGHPANRQDLNVGNDVLDQWHGPLLGVCIGFQGMAAANGGTIERLAQPMHGQVSQIHHTNSSLCAGLPNPFSATRYHSLHVIEPLPECFETLAWTKDRTVMAMRHKQRPQFGVQFHPESICTPAGKQLVSNFFALTKGSVNTVSAAASRLPKRTPPRFNNRRQGPPLIRKLDHYVDPEKAFERLYKHRKNAFWLDSCKPGFHRSRFSYMGSDDSPGSFTLRYWCDGQRLEKTSSSGITKQSVNLFDFLKQVLSERRIAEPSSPFDFNGGFVGNLGYELRADCGVRNPFQANQPDACLMYVDRFLVFDLEDRALYLVCESARADQHASAHTWMANVTSQLTADGNDPARVTPQPQCPTFRLQRDRQQYLQDIEQCQEKIAAGESYQICLTNKILTQRLADPFSVYQTLRQSNPAPYAAYLQFGDTQILCTSPEQFLYADKTGYVTSKPIKGSMRRDTDPALDQAIKQTLQACRKERAENLMIVDLLRNDLSRTCSPDTVRVPKLMDIESYAKIHQMVSTIEGRLAAEQTVIDCLQASFPGGSMTGAPKTRTMQFISELEQAPRGVYSGTLGYFSLCGAAELNIVIRTLVNTPEGASIGCGGAITALSNPASEFSEIMLKAAPIVEAILSQWIAEPHAAHFKVAGMDPMTPDQLMALTRQGQATQAARRSVAL